MGRGHKARTRLQESITCKARMRAPLPTCARATPRLCIPSHPSPLRKSFSAPAPVTSFTPERNPFPPSPLSHPSPLKEIFFRPRPCALRAVQALESKLREVQNVLEVVQRQRNELRQQYRVRARSRRGIRCSKDRMPDLQCKSELAPALRRKHSAHRQSGLDLHYVLVSQLAAGLPFGQRRLLTPSEQLGQPARHRWSAHPEQLLPGAPFCRWLPPPCRSVFSRYNSLLPAAPFFLPAHRRRRRSARRSRPSWQRRSGARMSRRGAAGAGRGTGV